MAKVVSVVISFLVMTAVIAKAMAAARMSNAAGRKLSKPGPTIIMTPSVHSTMHPTRLSVMRSPRNSTANTATQTGAVNSRANTVANGKSVMASAHPIWDPKWMVLRRPCSLIRRKLSSCHSDRFTTASPVSIKTPARLRTDIISNTFRSRAKARTDTAAVRKESSVPVIQITTRARSACDRVETLGPDPAGSAALPTSCPIDAGVGAARWCA